MSQFVVIRKNVEEREDPMLAPFQERLERAYKAVTPLITDVAWLVEYEGEKLPPIHHLGECEMWTARIVTGSIDDQMSGWTYQTPQ